VALNPRIVLPKKTSNIGAQRNKVNPQYCALLGQLSLEIILFLKTRPFGKYNLPSLEIKDKTR